MKNVQKDIIRTHILNISMNIEFTTDKIDKKLDEQLILFYIYEHYNYKDLKDMLSNIHEYMGQTATFTYFERTKAGSYRHPHYKCVRNYE